MEHKNLLLRSSISVSLFLFSGFLFSQVTVSDREYKPEPGQEGKDVRWFPTPQVLVDKMLDMAGVVPSDYLIDLGSGDGRTVITAARRGLHAIGIEYDHDLIELSRKNAAREGVKDRVEFIETDLFGYDLSKATVITLFLLPEINLRLRPGLLELKPGTRIVSTTFTMQDWQHDDMVKITDNTTKWTTAYLWIVPAKAGGTWKFNGGELKLTQKYQMLSGELITGAQSVKIKSGRLRGSEITFTAGGTIYKCKVMADAIRGTAETNGKISDWTAQKKIN